jgi:uncharacterized membrane protein (UPF0127 family)
MKLTNLENGQNLAKNVSVAKNFFQRFKGLMLTETLHPGCALHIIPCRSVHTYFMKYSIDVVHLDSRLQVVYVEESLPPNKVGKMTGRRTVSVVELPAGTIAETQTKVGDYLELTT